MHWLSLFEPTAAHIWMAVGVILCVCTGMVLALFVQGQYHNKTQRLLAQTQAEWRPWFNRIHFDDLPAMKLPADALRGGCIAQMWLEMLLRIDPGSRNRLISRARNTGLDAFVVSILRRPRWRSPAVLEACATLAGMLKLHSTNATLKSLMLHPTQAVAFAASLALLRLDPEAAEEVWQNAPSLDWSRAALLTLLKEVPADQVDDFVAHLIRQRPPKEAAQLLSAWAQLPGRGAAHYAEELLKDPEAEGWLLCAALRIQDDVTKTPQLLPYLDHSRWAVRLLAVRAIAKLGYGHDIHALAKFQDSDDWWVRLRAREALASMTAVEVS